MARVLTEPCAWKECSTFMPMACELSESAYSRIVLLLPPTASRVALAAAASVCTASSPNLSACSSRLLSMW